MHARHPPIALRIVPALLSLPALRAMPTLLALVGLLALLAPLHSHAGATYTVTALPAYFDPSDINNAGQMAGALHAGDGAVHAAVYADGNIIDLGTFGAAYSHATAINDAGAVAGNFGAAATVEHVFLYQDGRMRDIGAGNALGMNAGGAVVGQLYTGAGAAGFLYHDGVLTQLAHLGAGNISRATAVNDAGQVVGESNLAPDAQAPTHPYLHDGEGLHDLGTLANQGVNSAAAINNAGQIAGYSDAGNGRTHAFIHDRGVLTDLGSFGGLDTTIGGINQQGQIVGTGNTEDGPDVAFVSRGGLLVNLDTLVDPLAGWHITNAIDINDRGQVVANACRGGTCSAVRLDPLTAVPEPGSATLMACGLLTLAALGMGLQPLAALGLRLAGSGSIGHAPCRPWQLLACGLPALAALDLSLAGLCSPGKCWLRRRKKAAGPCGYGGS